MIDNPEFDRCMDFLSRMIEKYGNEFRLSKVENEYESSGTNDATLSDDKKRPSHEDFFSLDFREYSDTMELGQRKQSVVPKR